MVRRALASATKPPATGISCAASPANSWTPSACHPGRRIVRSREVVAAAGAFRAVLTQRIAGILRAVGRQAAGRHQANDHHQASDRHRASNRHRRDLAGGHHRRTTVPVACHRPLVSRVIGLRPRKPLRMARFLAANLSYLALNHQPASACHRRIAINRRRTINQPKAMQPGSTNKRRKTNSSRRRTTDLRRRCRARVLLQRSRTTRFAHRRRRRGQPGHSTFGRACCLSMRTARSSSAIPMYRQTLLSFRS